MIERNPDGKINNCAEANGHAASTCQMCAGNCPDREYQEALDAWRGLAEEEREEAIRSNESIAAIRGRTIYNPAQIAARLLKAASR